MPSFDAGKCEPVAEALACGNGVSWSQRRHWIIAGANVTAIQLLVCAGQVCDARGVKLAHQYRGVGTQRNCYNLFPAKLCQMDWLCWLGVEVGARGGGGGG